MNSDLTGITGKTTFEIKVSSNNIAATRVFTFNAG